MTLAELPPPSHVPLVDAPPPATTRPRLLVIATAFVAAGCLAGIAALIGIYLSERAAVLTDGRTWIPEGALFPLQQPNVLFGALLMSSVTIQWAVDAIKRDDRPQAYLALGITELFGVAVLNLAAYLYSVMELDIAGGTSIGVLVYTITGAHLVMLVAAMIFVGLMAFRALGGQFSSRQHDGLSAAALFWHAQVVAFGFIWYAIYITK